MATSPPRHPSTQTRLIFGPSRASAGGRGERGFTLIEVMVAMVITITVMTANLYLFTTAQKNLAFSRALTNATNLATEKLAFFKTRTIVQIVSGNDAPEADGVQFARAWVVSSVDLDHDGTPEMVGDVVKIRLEVSWTQGSKPHRVTMTTFSTGKPE